MVILSIKERFIGPHFQCIPDFWTNFDFKMSIGLYLLQSCKILMYVWQCAARRGVRVVLESNSATEVLLQAGLHQALWAVDCTYHLL